MNLKRTFEMDCLMYFLGFIVLVNLGKCSDEMISCYICNSLLDVGCASTLTGKASQTNSLQKYVNSCINLTQVPSFKRHFRSSYNARDYGCVTIIMKPDQNKDKYGIDLVFTRVVLRTCIIPTRNPCVRFDTLFTITNVKMVDCKICTSSLCNLGSEIFATPELVIIELLCLSVAALHYFHHRTDN